ncbi:hypothetical protein MMC12_001400 [Toensbergia leucococca]|nr:hypothetical protein [Toensbergia leucococca]
MIHSPLTYSPTIGRAGNATMTFDKQKTTINPRTIPNTNSPLLRNGKAPFPPKAISSPPSTASPRTKKDGLIGANGTPSSNGNTKEDIATPIKAFLSSNITPRSGSRKARLDSATSTPKDTPDASLISPRSASTFGGRERSIVDTIGIAGHVKTGSNVERMTRSTSVINDGKDSSPSFKSSSPEQILDGQNIGSPESLPKFFHASDVKSALSSEHMSGRPKSQEKTLPFLYANRDVTQAVGSSSLSSTSSGEQRPQFFHANGDLDSKPLAIKPGSSRPQSVISNTPAKAKAFSARSNALPQRPKSPLKDMQVSRKSSLSKGSPRHHKRLVSNGAAVQDIVLKSPDLQSLHQTDMSRRSSLSTVAPRRVGHAKTSSVNSITSKSGQRRSTNISDSSLWIQGEGLKLSPAVAPLLVNDNIPQSPANLTISPPQSPTETIPAPSKLEHLNELAANARRERKVLDLEISNSSLLAINRTLERSMRKQTAELRRYRRHTRLSTATSISTKSSSQRSSEPNLDPSIFSDTSDDEENAEDLSILDSESSLDTDSASFSPQTIRAKDEKRLQLDLSRHQALLTDSQKLNQSLKRCLGWTEDLIAEGKKALDYRVEIGTGGRVLTPEECEADVMRGTGLLSPALEDREELSWEREGGVSEEVGVEQTVEGAMDENITETKEDKGIGVINTPVERDGGKGLGEYLNSLGASWGI